LKFTNLWDPKIKQIFVNFSVEVDVYSTLTWLLLTVVLLLLVLLAVLWVNGRRRTR